MGHKRSTQADNGTHYRVSNRRVTRSKPRQYGDAAYNPVAGLQPNVITGHVQTFRKNTLNNQRNGGRSIRSAFGREGLAALEPGIGVASRRPSTNRYGR